MYHKKEKEAIKLIKRYKNENKEVLELELDFLRCPIELSNIENGDLFTEILIIDNDKIVKD